MTTEASADRVIIVGAAIVRAGADGPRVLCGRRSAPAPVAGRWEFPGGKVEDGETEAEAVVRECREELGVEVEVGDRIGADAPISERLVLRVYLARLLPDQPEPLPLEDHDRLEWVAPAALPGLDWLDPDIPIVHELSRRNL